MEQVQKKNILGTEPIGGLLRQFAVPSIIAMLVGALYNIVDQFFIGRSVGELGNAATNVVFPLTISCVALALLFGIGGAASFNLTLGGGEPLQKRTADSGASSTTGNICKHDYLIGGGGIFQPACDAGGADRVK